MLFQHENKKATFGSGCFWCTEAVFQNVKGVINSVSGYMGGNVKNPTYAQVCTGQTGHAEVREVEYNPEEISFKELMLIFLKSMTTTLNRQGNDTGTQYRSVIFYADDDQRSEAEMMIKKLNEEKVFDQKIVMQVLPEETFYKAEGYHQNYFNNNLCNLIVLL